MAERTGISWTDHTFNPWWGCTRVSPGCARCYAATLAERYGFDLWRPDGDRRTFTDGHWNDPVRWDRWAAAEGKRARVFCASMADVFEDHPALEEPRRRLFQLIERTPNLDWQVLTKRAPYMRAWIEGYYRQRALEGADGVQGFAATLPNLWLGVSAENQEQAELRIPQLLGTRAVVRFVSAEPLLERVTLRHLLERRDPLEAAARGGRIPRNQASSPSRIAWVIIGAESGKGARPMDLAWARGLLAECRGAGVAPFVKQVGARPVCKDPDCPGPCCGQPGWHPKAAKGDRPAEWPEDLRVQEFPPAVLVPLRARP